MIQDTYIDIAAAQLRKSWKLNVYPKQSLLSFHGAIACIATAIATADDTCNGHVTGVWVLTWQVACSGPDLVCHFLKVKEGAPT